MLTLSATDQRAIATSAMLIAVAWSRWTERRQQIGIKRLAETTRTKNGLITRGVAGDGAEAVRLAIIAGISVDMQSGLYNHHLPELVAAEHLFVTRVDAAVGGVLAQGTARPVRSTVPLTRRRGRT